MSDHLTKVEGYPDKKQAKAGMAHFPGGGPEGTCCFQCSKWGGRSNTRDKEGYLKPRRCRAYIGMRQRQGLGYINEGVQPETPSCKYFTPTKHERPLVKKGSSRGRNRFSKPENDGRAQPEGLPDQV